jgi:hypothetical protein
MESRLGRWSGSAPAPLGRVAQSLLLRVGERERDGEPGYVDAAHSASHAALSHFAFAFAVGIAVAGRREPDGERADWVLFWVGYVALLGRLMSFGRV